ncbi:thiol:disulfide interchange protein DsbG [Pseudorhodoferax soli]|uniref:thiol:disulfide interchange protein DsbG n=1 Tax=Pseudorhodoferax soli TaxID=545864 RepID=UPI001FE90EF8|nr:thiol:disulfide interchange protein DsbG [Pseudorhodoferax soli]
MKSNLPESEITSSRRRVLGGIAAFMGTTVAPWAVGAAAAAPAEAWKKLSERTSVVDGAASARHVVYAIIDPNCIWCHRFWKASRPWVDSGKVQVRYLLVGIIRGDSARKAATILSAPDPVAALEQNERNYANGGIFPSAALSPAIQATLESNRKLMLDLGLRGTPALVSRNKEGAVETVAGYPKEEVLAIVMGDR